MNRKERDSREIEKDNEREKEEGEKRLLRVSKNSHGLISLFRTFTSDPIFSLLSSLPILSFFCSEKVRFLNLPFSK